MKKNKRTKKRSKKIHTTIKEITQQHSQLVEQFNCAEYLEKILNEYEGNKSNIHEKSKEYFNKKIKIIKLLFEKIKNQEQIFLEQIKLFTIIEELKKKQGMLLG